MPQHLHKLLWPLLTIAGLFFFAFKSSNPAASTGIIGDVKYSLLSPTEFERENGKGWVLMDGQAIQQNWDIYTRVLQGRNSADQNNPYRLIQNNLPDARGLFLRGINAGRPGNGGDKEGDRLAGSYQGDMVGPHRHSLPQRMVVIRDNGYHAGVDAAFLGEISDSTGTNAGIETRPRNIALYVYVKVSD